MKEEKKPTDDWCAADSRIGIRGKEYFLQKLENEELVAIDIEVKQEIALIKEILAKGGLENKERIEAMKMVYLRKRQVNFIIAEFVRRKKLVKPLEHFSFQAVFLLMGKEALKQVKEMCRELQEEDRAANNPFSVRHGLLIPPEAYKKDKMCGSDEKPKIKYKTGELAQRNIEELKRGKHDVRGLNVYGPCPFCGFFHIGHMPEKYLWMKEQEKKKKREKKKKGQEGGGEPA